MNERELKEAFAAVREGDKDAFAQIYCDLKSAVYTLVWRIVRSRAIAEEITQDVFVKLYVCPPQPLIKNLRAWIFRIARNQAIDALRKRETVELDEAQFLADAEYDDLALRLDLEGAIGRLSCTERQILTLHLNSGLTFAQIAGIVEMSLPAVYRKYRGAIKKLRYQLSGGNL